MYKTCCKFKTCLSINQTHGYITLVRGVPRHFLLVSLGGAYGEEIQYGRVSAHKESPRYDMLRGFGDLLSLKILKI